MHISCCCGSLIVDNLHEAIDMLVG